MRLTIVTPSFNQGRFLERTLRSVLDQRYPDLEYWVIDGGSTDNSVEILRRHEADLQWLSEPDRGQGDAVNKGFERATGGVIGWINSDDTYVPGSFERVMRVFQEDEEIDFVYGDCNMVDEDDRLLRFRRIGSFSRRRLIRMGVSYLCQPSVFFRKRLLDVVGGCDTSLKHGMDYDLWCRMTETAHPCYLPAALSNWRYQSDSKTCSERHVSIAEGRLIRRRYRNGVTDLPWCWYYDLRVRLYLLIEPALLGWKPRP